MKQKKLHRIKYAAASNWFVPFDGATERSIP